MVSGSKQKTSPTAAPSSSRVGIYLIIVFLTGATTLALELLASRVMTPYFGVSLYIWTGILSITLIALALGYFFGGKLTGGREVVPANELEFRFLLMPALSSLAITGACAVYPFVFTDLAGFSLVAGAFIACSLLIFLPLVAVSSMNPLLIAIDSVAGSQSSVQGDSGSGRVFFISTVGSVAGVLFTAFVFIPNLTNFNSMLILAAVLSVLTLCGAWSASDLHKGRARRLQILAVLGLVVAATLLFYSSDYLKKRDSIAFNNNFWTLQEEYSSLFGNTKVIKITGDWSAPGPDGKERYVNIFINDGTVMNTMDSNGNSLSPFTYALEFAALGLKPDARSALVLGLGAGVIPTRLSAKGVQTDVVEINPDYLTAAVKHFGFDPSVADVVQADARTFVRGCDRQYDVVVIDLFQADGVPDYLLTREFFTDIANCMSADGVASFNTLAVLDHLDAYYHIIKTLQSVFPEILMFYDEPRPGRDGMNIYLAASRRPLNWNEKIPLADVPPAIAGVLDRAFASPRPLDQTLLARASTVEDKFNVFSILNNEPDRIHRRTTLQSFPPEFLVN